MLNVNTEDVIMHPDRTWGIIKKGKVEFDGFKKLTWEEFKDIYELQMLSGKPNYNFSRLKIAKQLLKAFGETLDDCEYHYQKDKPLIIDAMRDFYILIAPQVW